MSNNYTIIGKGKITPYDSVKTKNVTLFKLDNLDVKFGVYPIKRGCSTVILETGEYVNFFNHNETTTEIIEKIAEIYKDVSQEELDKNVSEYRNTNNELAAKEKEKELIKKEEDKKKREKKKHLENDYLEVPYVYNGKNEIAKVLENYKDINVLITSKDKDGNRVNPEVEVRKGRIIIFSHLPNNKFYIYKHKNCYYINEYDTGLAIAFAECLFYTNIAFESILKNELMDAFDKMTEDLLSKYIDKAKETYKEIEFPINK